MVNNNKIILTGASGQLGRTFIKISNKYPNHLFHFFSKGDLDITNFQLVENIIKNIKPNIIINCAAYTDVNSSEKNKKIVNLINNISVENLAKLCYKYEIRLIHFSTDYVFDGNTDSPYHETDKANPINFYGYSKLLGDNSILKLNLKDSFVIRTSWLFSEYNTNFVKKIIDKANLGIDIKVKENEFGSPTYAMDLAIITMYLIQNIKNEGAEIFNISNVGICSRYDFAKKILEFTNHNKKIYKFYDDNSEIKRPIFSALSTKKISKLLDFKINKWEDGLKLMIKEMKL